ncbi:MAG: hypothetical protein WDN04_11860 [Rhodospirillales bacterium]
MADTEKRDREGSPDRFGYEWGTYAEILPIYEEQVSAAGRRAWLRRTGVVRPFSTLAAAWAATVSGR